jgi:hypothetical protein
MDFFFGPYTRSKHYDAPMLVGSLDVDKGEIMNKAASIFDDLVTSGRQAASILLLAVSGLVSILA